MSFEIDINKRNFVKRLGLTAFGTGLLALSAKKAFASSVIADSFHGVLSDLDGDTKIQVEESADEDYIRFDTGTVERLTIDNYGRFTATSLLNQATGNEAAFTLNYTTNKATSGNDTGLLINMTDTLSPGTSLLADFQVGGVSKLFIASNGGIYPVGGIHTTSSYISSTYGFIFSESGQNDGVITGYILKRYSGPSDGNTGWKYTTSIGNSITSGTIYGFGIYPIYNQTSGTAANTDLCINRTETAVGSGAQLLLDAQVGSVSKFSVSNRGVVTNPGTLQTLTGAGAVDIISPITHLVTTASDALTLADGAEGQYKIIIMKTDGGDGTLTPAHPGGYATITFNDVGDSAQLLFTNGAWHFIGGTATLA